MRVPSAVVDLARACQAAGGRAWLVGGCVRDDLLGLPLKDVDIEVHGLPAPALEAVLRGLGKVNQVGRSFGVYKLTVGRHTLDVSLPRRDSNVGPGHRGIRVEGDPEMGVVEAARRRDLTINAMLEDPLTGEVADPFGGRADLEARLLRAVDAATFLEDPLRALRVVQFAGRFGFQADPELIALCRRAPLDELPAERVWGELEKLLLRSPRPSVGLRVARQAQVLRRVLPEVDACPAGAVDAAVDRAALERDQAGPAPRPLALMLGALLHGLDPAAAQAALDRLQVHTLARYPLRERVLGVVGAWPQVAAPATDTTLRSLAETHPLDLLCRLAWAASGEPDARAALARAQVLGIAEQPLPLLLQGRDLRDLGARPGPLMGRILAEIRRAQVEGRVGTMEQALDLARQLLARPDA